MSQYLQPNDQLEIKEQKKIFKLWLGALIPRSVGLSVCRSSKNYKKITKLYKTLQNLPIYSGYCHQQCRGLNEQCHTQIF